jgi:GNAT superfamily N-acetyltransferase
MFEILSKAPKKVINVSLPEKTSSDSPGWFDQPQRGAVMVPIRSLGENHRARISTHLKALNAHDRYFRFGFAASDEQVQRYVDGLNFERDEIFGIYNRRLELIAMAHLAYSQDKRLNACSEFGVSVLERSRGRGYGARLFERAVMHARNEGVRMMFIHVLSENKAMLAIARHAGATVERDGSESEAHLNLAPATMNTQLTEIFEEHVAQANYRLKVQAKHFRESLSRFHDLWFSVGQGTRPD